MRDSEIGQPRPISEPYFSHIAQQLINIVHFGTQQSGFYRGGALTSGVAFTRGLHCILGGNL